MQQAALAASSQYRLWQSPRPQRLVYIEYKNSSNKCKNWERHTLSLPKVPANSHYITVHNENGLTEIQNTEFLTCTLTKIIEDNIRNSKLKRLICQKKRRDSWADRQWPSVTQQYKQVPVRRCVKCRNLYSSCSRIQQNKQQLYYSQKNFKFKRLHCLVCERLIFKLERSLDTWPILILQLDKLWNINFQVHIPKPVEAVGYWLS